MNPKQYTLEPFAGGFPVHEHRTDAGWSADMGYSQSELDEIQAQWNLRFPPDLIDLLREQRPLLGESPGSFDWLLSDPATIQRNLDGPFEGFWFDVDHNDDLWWPEWGDKPIPRGEQRERLKEIFGVAPRLIPLYSNRYIPQEPLEVGNPVFSIVQMDIICYGSDLSDWIERERRGWSTKPWRPIKEIRFWSEALRKNNAEPRSSTH